MVSLSSNKIRTEDVPQVQVVTGADIVMRLDSSLQSFKRTHGAGFR